MCLTYILAAQTPLWLRQLDKLELENDHTNTKHVNPMTAIMFVTDVFVCDHGDGPKKVAYFWLKPHNRFKKEKTVC